MKHIEWWDDETGKSFLSAYGNIIGYYEDKHIKRSNIMYESKK